MTTNEVFLDTAFAVALAIQKDALHDEAVRLARRLREARTRMITTQAVVFELGNALSKAQLRSRAIALIESFRGGGDVEVVTVSDELFDDSFALYRDRPDKGWSLTDCLSFVVMRQRGINEVLTADDHFRQAGFRPLLASSRS